MFTKNVKSNKISKHNQKRRGIVNLNVNIVKHSSGLSTKALARKAAKANWNLRPQ